MIREFEKEDGIIVDSFTSFQIVKVYLPRPTTFFYKKKNLFLDKRASKSDEGVVKWLVFHKGKQRLFTTGLKISEQDWDFLKKHKSGIPGQVKNDYRRKLWNKLFGSTYEKEYTGKEVESFLGRARTIVGKLVFFAYDTFNEGF